MQINEIWLREWVNTHLSSKELLNQIGMIGLDIENIQPVTNKFHNIIVGEIVECKANFSINKSYLTKVNIGKKRLVSIVCSKKNCRYGLKVAVAVFGSILPENVKIKNIKIYGELSEGILCSLFNLGISEDNSNIIELPVNALVGKNICDYLNLNDNIIQINITPNRADCLSIIGIARDIAALNKVKMKSLVISSFPIISSDVPSIQIDTPELCPRYLGRLVKKINIQALTPIWMKERLLRCGIYSVNAVTDIINYILLELGQPVHIFDNDRIEGSIIVRMAKEGETTVLSDEHNVTLNSDTLVVADSKKILAVGGILASKYASVDKATKNIFIECAFFDPFAIIGRAKRYGIHTNTALRYERGVDFTLQYKAIERATELLINICGGIACPVLDCTSEVHLPKYKTVILYRKKLDRLIGYHISDIKVNDILYRLGFQVIKYNDHWKIIVPSWRFDIEIAEDVIEEISRIYGYNNIPCQFHLPVQKHSEEKNHFKSTVSLKRAKTLLIDKGYQEVITYSFVDPKIQELIHPDKNALILPFPISREMSVMRVSLWTGLIGTIIYNQNRQQDRVRIFETGLCFVPDKEANLGIRQDFMLAGAIVGNHYNEHWSIKKRSVDFYDIKGDVESVFDLTGKLSEVKFCKKIIPALHPGQSASISLQEKHIGFIGVIHPELEQKLHLHGQVIIFELDWNRMADRIIIPRIHEPSRFPTNRRDISIIVPESIPAEVILAECKKIDNNKLVKVNLFDVYYGKGVRKGYKSLAISLYFQDAKYTLKEKEISSIVSSCIEVLKKKFQASLRDKIYNSFIKDDKQ